jgi:hypothetical protein
MPLDLHPAYEVTSPESNFHVIVMLGLVEGVERLEANLCQFRLGLFPSGKLAGAELLDEFGDS